MPFITLLTDFGLQDGYPGIMRGVIYGIAPRAQIIDITHLIAPQDVFGGALALQRSYRYFPAGTIHVAVVDPGVGTQRRPLAAQLGEHIFVGPDNGIFTPLIREADVNGWRIALIHLTNPEYWLPNPSHVFHGRDVFAPVAAHLAAGASLTDLGEPITDPLLLDIPSPTRSANELVGQVMHVDRFGNVATNIASEAIKHASVRIKIGACEIPHLVKTFGEAPPGTIVGLIDSSGWLAICAVNGNAQIRLGIGVGDPVYVTFESGE